jgi:tRNA(fMet)-specific endonuclease VapC
MIFLDTNVIIAATNKRPVSTAARYDAELLKGARLYISSVVLFELHYGVAKSARRAANAVILDHVLTSLTVVPFDTEDAALAGDIRATLEAAGTPIGPYDVLIAAQARRREATLVTANVREFARVPGLTVQDWGGA